MRLVLPSLVLIALAAGCVNRQSQALAKQTSALVSAKAKPVSAVQVATRALAETLSITGQLASDSETSVGSKVSGKLAAVYVRSGSFVSVGQLVATLDGSTQSIAVSQARAQVNAASSALQQALTNQRVAPQRSAAAVAAAQAQVRSAKAQLAKALKGARPEERKQADAAVQAAQSNMETLQRQRDRIARLYEEGAASKQALEQAENAYQAALSQYTQALQQQAMTQNWTRPEDIEAARAQVQQAEQGLQQARASQKLDAILADQTASARANLDSARSQLNLAMQNLSDTQVRAPFSGQVSGTPLQAGTVVSPGTPIARLVGSGGVYFEGDVPATELNSVQVGSPVSIKIDGAASSALIGRVDAVSPSASSVGRVFKVRVALPAGAGGAKPGMFARGEVTIRTIPSAKVVPSSAVVTRGDQTVVFVVENGKAKLVPVVVGVSKDGLSQVTGVDAGASVVTAGIGEIEDGSEVTIAKPRASLRSPLWA